MLTFKKFELSREYFPSPLNFKFLGLNIVFIFKSEKWILVISSIRKLFLIGLDSLKLHFSSFPVTL